jgi:transposase
VEDSSDAFNKKSRKELELKVQGLPPHTRYSAERVLEQLDSVQEQIELFEERMKKVFVTNKELRLLMSLPGVGFILAVVIFSEVGDIDRFPTAAQFASYAGTAPRVHASGGKVRLGQLRSDVNRYLKWAFIEAANSISVNRWRCLQRHVNQLYERVRSRRGHQTAVGAVVRHLAEATFWVLKKREEYREPIQTRISSTKR